MKNENRSDKKRMIGTLRRFATPLAALGILLILALNLGVTALMQENVAYLDLTPEGMYTLSDAMIDECEKVTGDITITFCDDPDRLLDRFETRYVYVMAKKLANKFDNIKVETYNLTLNPTALDRFRSVSSTGLRSDTVIVSCGDRYRTYSADSFWVSGSDGTSGKEKYWSFDGEYVMATAFFSLSAIEQPVVYFSYGNGEKFYVSEDDTEHAALLPMSRDDQSAFYDLLLKEGLKVDYLDLSTVDEIPEDCACLIINGATEDIGSGDPSSYYGIPVSEMLDRYISRGSGSVMIFKDPDYTLPNLEEFSEKWGISFVNGSTVADAVQSLADSVSTPADRVNEKLVADYSSDTKGGSYAVYKGLASLDTAPRVIVERTGSVKLAWETEKILVSGNRAASAWYSGFLFSSENAKTYSIGEGHELTGEDGVYTLAALSAREWMDSITTEQYFSYVFGAATTELTTNEYLTNASYANYDVMFALIRQVSRVTKYADFNLGSTSLNSEKVGGKRLQYCKMQPNDYTEAITRDEYAGFTSASLTVWTLVIASIPVLAVPIVGTVVYLKRRNR
jgi:hypothetical protein